MRLHYWKIHLIVKFWVVTQAVWGSVNESILFVRQEYGTTLGVQPRAILRKLQGKIVNTTGDGQLHAILKIIGDQNLNFSRK